MSEEIRSLERERGKHLTALGKEHLGALILRHHDEIRSGEDDMDKLRKKVAAELYEAGAALPVDAILDKDPQGRLCVVVPENAPEVASWNARLEQLRAEKEAAMDSFVRGIPR